MGLMTKATSHIRRIATFQQTGGIHHAWVITNSDDDQGVLDAAKEPRPHVRHGVGIDDDTLTAMRHSWAEYEKFVPVIYRSPDGVDVESV